MAKPSRSGRSLVSPTMILLVGLLLSVLIGGSSDAAPVRVQLVKQSAPAQPMSEGFPESGLVEGGYVDRCEVFIDGNSLYAARAHDAPRMRAPEVTVDLAPGKHTLAPGNHEFVVNDNGTVTTTAAGLAAAGGTRLNVLMVPVTFETRDTESGARRVPGLLQPVLLGATRLFERSWHLSPRFPTFATVFVPVGSEVALQPQGATLAVSADTVAIKSDPTESLHADGLTVTVNLTPFRFTFQRNGHQVGRGMSLSVQAAAVFMEQPSVYQWGGPTGDYKWLLPASTTPLPLHVQHSLHEFGRIAPGTHLCPPLTFDNRQCVSSSLLLSRLDERSDGTYAFLAGISKLKYQAGDAIDVRYTFHQQGISPAMVDARVGVSLRPEQFSLREASLPWQSLEVASAEGKATVKLPSDLSTNRYRLRVAMVEAKSGDEGMSQLYRDFIIGVVNPAQQTIASLTLPAQRWIYRAGEEIEAQGMIQLKAPTAGSIRLRVRGERLDQMLDGAPASDFAAGRHGQGWVLSSKLTSAMKPGNYTLTAIFVGADGKTLAESLPQQVTLSSSVRRSLFPGIIDCYYQGVGAWLGGSREGARQIFGVGADVIRFDSWNVTLPNAPILPFESGRARETSFQNDPDLPPLDVMRSPPGMSRAFDEALSYGAAVLPSLFPSDGPRIETQLPNLLAEQRRFIRLHAQYYRRNPTYAGISYSHWSGPSYTGGQAGATNPPPADVVEATRAAIWQDFCKKFGFSGDPPTTWYQAAAVAGGAATPANPDLWSKWIRYTNDLLPNVHRDWAQAAAEVCPGMVNTDSRGAPGFWNGPRGAYDSHPYGNHFQSTAGFNLIEGVTNDDWGIEPYSLELMADIFSFGWRRGKPVWVGGWAQNGMAKSEYQREAIQTLARGALPALYGSSLAPVFASRHTDDWLHQDWGRRQATQRVFQTTAAYGEWAWRFNTDKPLGILASFSQSVAEGRPGYAQISHHGAAIYEAYVSCLLAGYSPTFVFEEEVAADPKVLERFKAILLVDITVPPQAPITNALQSFAKAGGVVIADAAGAKELPASVRLPVAFEAYLKYGSTEFGKEQTSTEYTSGYWWHMRKIAQDNRAPIQATLRDVLQPIAAARGPGVLLTTARSGDGLLVYAANDTPLPYRYSMEMARPVAYVHQCWTSPDATADLTLRAPGGVLYDALRVREVPTEKVEGGLRFTAGFSDLSATMYVLLPRRIHAVQVEGAARAGALALRAQVTDDASKAIGAPVPLEIVVSDAASAERYRLYRAAGPDGWVEELPVALNDSPGDWTVSIRELLSGKSVTANVAVQPAADPQAPAARPALVVTDQGAVTAFLKSERPITIALDRRQAALQGVAKRLADVLTASKHPTQVRWIDELPRGPMYTKMLWSESPLPPSDPVQGSLILLGVPRENVLLEKLSDAGVLLREASDSYPGDGGAVITHVWSAFTGDEPVLAIMANGEKSLMAAGSHVAEILEGKAPASYDPAPNLEQARQQVMPPLFRATWATRPLAPEAVSSDVIASLKPLAEAAGQSADQAINPGGDPIRALAVSGDESVCVMGTDGATNAVHRLGKDGKKLEIPGNNRQFVAQIGLNPDASLTVVATTQPPAVFVLDATGKELWSKTNIPFNWGTDPRWMRDEPDYFALSPTGDRVVIREKEQRLVCYETATGKQVWERSCASTDARIWRDAHRLRFSGDGKRLVASVTSYLTDPEAATKLGTMTSETLDADLKALDAEARHRVISIDPATGEVRWSCSERTVPVSTGVPRGHPFYPPYTPRPDLDVRGLRYQPRVLGYYLSVSHDGSRIAASDELGYHSIYAGDGKLMVSYEATGRPALSPDGKTLAVYRDAIVLIDLATGKPRSLTPAGEEEVSDIAWSLDNGRLAVARWDGTIHVVDVATGNTLATVRQPHGIGAVLLPVPSGWLAGTSHGQLLRIDGDGKLR